MKTILTIFLSLVIIQASAVTFYVDPVSGNDANNGTSQLTPWRTLSKVSSSQGSINPGDYILFKRGTKVSGRMTISRSGTAGNPITFGAYGTGANPIFWGTGATIDHLFYMNNRSYLIFENLQFIDTTISATDRSIPSKIQRVFYVDGTSNNVICRGLVMDRVGIGAYWVGPYNTMEGCDIGNLRMVRNTPVSVNPDDDYGANPLVISSANNKIISNHFHDCWADSYDYNYDGGAVEFFGPGTHNNFVAYNLMHDNNGIAEFGSSSGGTSTNNVFAYNLLINNGSIFYINNSSTWFISVSQLQWYNNIVVETVMQRLNEPYMAAMALPSSNSGIVTFANNIFWLTTGVDLAQANRFNGVQLLKFNNIYRLGPGSLLNYPAGSTDITTSSSIWNSQSGYPTTWDFRLANLSPGRKYGINVGQTRDYFGNPVSNTPNCGISEDVISNQFKSKIIFKNLP